jgi:hypothetical protein
MSMKNRGRVIGTSPYGGGSSLVSREFAALNLSALADLSDGGVAASREVTYRCLVGHDLTMRFSAEARVPQLWECAVHRQNAPLADPAVVEAAGAALAEEFAVATGHVPKTHWEHVMERRTVPELEDLLAERLVFLRARRGMAPVERDEVA